MESNCLSAAELRHAAGAVTTYESFARSLMQHVLDTAGEQAENSGNEQRETIELSLPVTVKRIGRIGCIRVCVQGAGCVVWCPDPVE